MKKLLFALSLPMSLSAQKMLEGTYISASGTGGIAPYTFSLDGSGVYQSSNTFYNVPPGNHTVYTKDSRNCINVSTCVLYAPIKLALVSTTRTSITVSASSGKPPYYYNINRNSNYTLNKTRFSNLRKGTTYIITVKDSLNYTSSISVGL
jgi:hypothetical protein